MPTFWKSSSHSGSMDFGGSSSSPRSRLSRIVLVIFVFAFIFVFISTVFFAYSTWKSKENVNLVLFPSPNADTIKVQIDGNIEVKSVGINQVEKMVANPSCPRIEDNDRFDCHPEPNANEESCLRRGCCWKSSNGSTFINGPAPLGLPTCYYPPDYAGYELTKSSENKNGITATLRRKVPSGFPKDIQELRLDVTFLDENRLRFRITDANAMRYEVPVPLIRSVARGRSVDRNYEVTLDQGKLTITRKSNGLKIVEANIATMVYANQLLQLNIKVPTAGFYGLGESQDQLLRGHDWKRYVLFARDRSPEVNLNLYGTHPFYLQMEEDSQSHGLFLHNSNLLEIVTQPSPGITFRPIGGVFDFYVLLASSPAEVVKQYQDLIGRPIMPPYWSLGFHLCRWGYGSLNETKRIWQKNRDAQIPFDVQWNDIDYMDHYNDFTYDKVHFAGLPGFVDELHSVGMHYVMIMDVGVSGAEKRGTYPPFDDGVDMDVFIKNTTGDVLLGHVWNDVDTAFPDYLHPRANEYFAELYNRLYTEMKFDGAWIDMNEPSNLVDGSLWSCPKDNELESPPYKPQGMGDTEYLYVKTICMSSRHHSTFHYNVHNIHGFTNGIATNYALNQIMPNKRPFIISRSTYMGQGYYTGHWSGDTHSTWEHLKWSIPSTLNFAMFGFSMMGTDICGFTDNTTMELCSRWQSLGAFYPFSRNHNTLGTIDQDPASMGGSVLSATKNALTIRYRLLPFLYTLFHKSHAYGDTLFRPLFFEYPSDKNTYAVDNSFLWGPSLMVVPVLEEKSTKAVAYIPNDVWYNYKTGALIKGVGATVTFSTALDEINVLLRGGYVIPAQTPGLTTTESRKNNLELIVALKNGEASGDLFWDDGETANTYENGQYNFVEFQAKNNAISGTPKVSGYNTTMTLGSVDVYGVSKPSQSAVVNGQPATVSYNADNQLLKISGFQASLLDRLEISWK